MLRGILDGGALGAGLGTEALAIPGVGPIAAAGAIAAGAVHEATAIGAGIGALTVAFNEVLTKHGVSEKDATYYGGRMNDGGVVVTVGGDDIDAERAGESFITAAVTTRRKSARPTPGALTMDG
ncbi:hypothetical protein [Sphingomonas sp. M1-B02]|uniref:hypothetical protein n=1 Tax=Sphingomonas sp. M1-B02 TaxID=3114300 RepID=UPI002240206C|nr:hypothetical protein [Sphingomonas sp. S6-11]UZK66703.1 hypothetical protein OKW87_02360 [Sphingomonas sp. S6-11]